MKCPLQFEHGILEACIYLMDAAKMPIRDRNKVLKVIRVGSAMVRTSLFRRSNQQAKLS